MQCPGPFSLAVTVFLSPEPLSPLAAVVSVSLQRLTAGKPAQAERTTYQPERRNFNNKYSFGCALGWVENCATFLINQS